MFYEGSDVVNGDSRDKNVTEKARDRYELRARDRGFELSGGRLEEPWLFETSDPDEPIRTVGFLSLLKGGVLCVYDRDGNCTSTRTFPQAVHASFERGSEPLTNRER